MGVPVIACTCPVCTSKFSENKRLRSSGLLKLGHRRILVDAGPDFREQALRYKIDSLDGVIFTHTHYDHSGGLDDLRIYYFRTNEPVPCLLSRASYEDLRQRLAYLFRQEDGVSNVAAKFDFQIMESDGDVEFLDQQFRVFSYSHGGMEVVGLRLGNFAYVTDIFDYPETIFEELKDLKILVLSALRYSYSHVHFTVEQALDFAKAVGADMTYFTHAAHEIDHHAANAELPSHIQFSYDGLEISFDYD